MFTCTTETQVRTGMILRYPIQTLDAMAVGYTIYWLHWNTAYTKRNVPNRNLTNLERLCRRNNRMRDVKMGKKWESLYGLDRTFSNQQRCLFKCSQFFKASSRDNLRDDPEKSRGMLFTAWMAKLFLTPINISDQSTAFFPLFGMDLSVSFLKANFLWVRHAMSFLTSHRTRW